MRDLKQSRENSGAFTDWDYDWSKASWFRKSGVIDSNIVWRPVFAIKAYSFLYLV